MRYAPLAQLDRASGYGPEGQGFESLAACQGNHRFCLEIGGFSLFLGYLAFSREI